MLLLLRAPDRQALEAAAAAFEHAPGPGPEAALAPALEAFCTRAEMLVVFISKVGGRPNLN